MSYAWSSTLVFLYQYGDCLFVCEASDIFKITQNLTNVEFVIVLVWHFINISRRSYFGASFKIMARPLFIKIYHEK